MPWAQTTHPKPHGSTKPHPNVQKTRRNQAFNFNPCSISQPGGFIWVFPKKSGTPKRMVKIMQNPIKMDDLGVPPFSETTIYLKGLLAWLLNFISHLHSEWLQWCAYTLSGHPVRHRRPWIVPRQTVFNEGFLMIGKRSNFCPLKNGWRKYPPGN